MNLHKAELLKLIKGASLLTTGGGLSCAEQYASMEKHKDIQIRLAGLDHFTSDDILITAAEVGPADAPELPKAALLPKMAALWERMTGTNIAGIYAPEMGQEVIVIETAHALNVPLVDFDMAGGRAVPFVDVNSLNIALPGYSMTPLIMATDRGDLISVDSPASMARTEEILRTMTGLSETGILFFMGGKVRAGDLAGKGIENKSLSTALALGAAKSLDDILKAFSPISVLSGAVTRKEETERAGFNCFMADFLTDNGQSYALYILNEVLFIKDEAGQLLAQTPDKIMIIDPATLAGMPCKDLLSGKPAVLCTVKADPFWQSDKAMALFGPDRFKGLL